MIRQPRRQLDGTIDRVLALLQLFRSLTRTGRPPSHLSDLLRGAVVLTAAALDAYMHDVIATACPAAEGRGQLGAVARRWVDRDAALTTLPAGVARRRRVRELVAAKLERTTIATSAAVTEQLRSVLGAGAPWATAAMAVSTAEDPVDELGVRARLDSFVTRRHRIAHLGDRTTRGGLAHINADYVEDQAYLVTKIGDAVEKVVRDRLS